MSHTMTFILIFNALLVGNYAWQAITGQARGWADERSFFQAIALFAAWLATRGDA